MFGRSAAAWALASESASVVTVDKVDRIAVIKPNLAWAGVSGRVRALIGDGARIQLNRKFDCIYIDGEHDYESVLRDIKRWDCSANHIICGHDYSEHFPGVIKAVDEFYDKIEKIGKQNPIWLVKK